jgi:hypothetical protein
MTTGPYLSRLNPERRQAVERESYGLGFAPGFVDHAKLSDVLAKLDEPSLTQLIRDHEAGKLGLICRG